MQEVREKIDHAKASGVYEDKAKKTALCAEMKVLFTTAGEQGTWASPPLACPPICKKSLTAPSHRRGHAGEFGGAKEASRRAWCDARAFDVPLPPSPTP